MKKRLLIIVSLILFLIGKSYSQSFDTLTVERQIKKMYYDFQSSKSTYQKIGITFSSKNESFDEEDVGDTPITFKYDSLYMNLNKVNLIIDYKEDVLWTKNFTRTEYYFSNDSLYFVFETKGSRTQVPMYAENNEEYPATQKETRIYIRNDRCFKVLEKNASGSNNTIDSLIKMTRNESIEYKFPYISQDAYTLREELIEKLLNK